MNLRVGQNHRKFPRICDGLYEHIYDTSVAAETQQYFLSLIYERIAIYEDIYDTSVAETVPRILDTQLHWSAWGLVWCARACVWVWQLGHTRFVAAEVFGISHLRAAWGKSTIFYRERHRNNNRWLVYLVGDISTLTHVNLGNALLKSTCREIALYSFSVLSRERICYN